MTKRVFDNGVREFTGSFLGSAYRVVHVPRSAIKSATLEKPAAWTRVENVTGDIVANWWPWTVGARISGTPLHSYVPFNPWVAWEGTRLVIHHREKGTVSYNAFHTVAQGFRYIIDQGVKNPNATPDWNVRHERRFIGNNVAGDTYIVGIGTNSQLGVTAHEAYDLVKSLNVGLYYLVEGDGGGSLQDYILVNGKQEVFRGTSEIRNVPVYTVIKLNTPLTEDAPPPPSGSITHEIKVYDTGAISVDGGAPF